jgi:hypothetical protein
MKKARLREQSALLFCRVFGFAERAFNSLPRRG